MNLAGRGNGTLVAWCLMPEVLKRHPHLVNPDGHRGDGISLTVGKFDFTNFKENEMSLEGVMFYSTDPASDWGYVIRNPDNGHHNGGGAGGGRFNNEGKHKGQCGALCE